MPQMTKCEACEATISEAAVTCPKCGHPMKKQPKQNKSSSSGCLVIVLALVILGVVGSQLPSTGTGSGKKTATTTEAKAPLSPEEKRKQQIKRQFSAWDGAHINLEMLIEENLKDPDSYQHIETRYRDNGDSILVTTKYRAKNSFGGYVVNTVVATYDLEGNLLVAPVSLNE